MAAKSTATRPSNGRGSEDQRRINSGTPRHNGRSCRSLQCRPHPVNRLETSRTDLALFHTASRRGQRCFSEPATPSGRAEYEIVWATLFSNQCWPARLGALAEVSLGRCADDSVSIVEYSLHPIVQLREKDKCLCTKLLDSVPPLERGNFQMRWDLVFGEEQREN